jgi:1,4-alpha-glucan branching enzyme
VPTSTTTPTRASAGTPTGALVFNKNRPEVRNYLLSSALFWISEYHVDGLKVDAASSILNLDYSPIQASGFRTCTLATRTSRL